MDRNTITGLLLIFLVMIAWFYFSMPSEQERQQQKLEQARKDSIAAIQADSQQAATAVDTTAKDTSLSQPGQSQISEQQDEDKPAEMGIFGQASQSDTTTLSVDTPLYHSRFTNLGAGPATFTLKKYKTWNKKPLQLIKDTTRSAYSVGFLTSENYNVETSHLAFKQLTQKKSIHLQKGDSTQIKYALQVAPDKRILYTYTLRGGSYEIDLDITYQGLERDIIGSSIDFGWKPRLNLTEKNKNQEAGLVSAYAYTGGELEQLSLGESGRKDKTYNGTVDWVSTRTKFFTQIISSENATESARLVGQVSDAADQDVADHHYESYLTTHIPDNGVTKYKMYIGPLAYHALDNFEPTTFNMVNVGYSWTRWFSAPLVKYVIIPYFDLMSNFMNLGIAIVVFGILVKMILYPFTKKSYKSMAAMKELQPELQEIKDKYEDDPQKQQKETMKLYKEANANPIGGCLPNLLQLPILVTLYRFIQHSILMRGEAFLWAKDLSTPDYIIHLPFSIPIIGDQIAGFVLLMTAAMIVQSRLTGGMGGPGGGGGAGGMGKMMQYFFPLMLLFIFNNFAAGLSLYYLVYNVVSILQQLMINRQLEEEKAVAETA